MTTFSDPGFRITGPDDDEPGDSDVEATDLDELDVDLDLDVEDESENEVDAEAEVDSDDEIDTEIEAEEDVDVDAELDIDIDDELEDADLDDIDLDDIELGDVELSDADIELLATDFDIQIDIEDPDVEKSDVDTREIEESDVDTPEIEDRDIHELEEFEDDPEAEAEAEAELEDLVVEEHLVVEEDLVVEAPVADLNPATTAEVSLVEPAPAAQQSEPSPFWSAGQVAAVGKKALAVLVVMGILGYGLGALRGNSHVARTEFVYTLDESVPDSFLREDRRLLTQVVTFKSDAVLTPVAEDFDLTVDQLRSKIDVQTLELSEVLRFDVSDADEDRAIALSRAVLNQYLQVITDASPAGDSTAELAQRRADVAAELATSDAERKTLVEARQRDVALEVRQESIQRQVDLRSEQLNRIQGSLDDALVQTLTAARQADLNAQYEVTQLLIADLETDLIDVGSQRAALSSQTTAEPALLREIERLETVLTTIDDELSQRELAPLVASPIRELSDPIILFQSRNVFGLQGMAFGLLLGFPIAALIAYRTRKRQLWFD